MNKLRDKKPRFFLFNKNRQERIENRLENKKKRKAVPGKRKKGSNFLFDEQKNECKIKKTLKKKNVLYINLVEGEDGKKIILKTKKNGPLTFNEKLAIKFKTKDIQTGILAKARKVVKNHYNKRSRLYRFLFVFINVAVIIGILIEQNATLGVIKFEQLMKMDNNYIYLLYAFLAIAIVMVLETLKTYLCIKKSANKNSLMLSYKSSVVNKYYDLIMPLAYLTGGKTFEVIYLNKNDVKVSVATSVPLAKYLFNTIASVMISTVLLITKWTYLKESSNLILFLGLLMLIVNALVIFTLLIFSINSRVGSKIVILVLKLLQKLGIIKSYRDNFYKFMRFISEYQRSIKFYVKSKFVTVVSVIASLLTNIIHAIIPFLVYSIFAPPTMEILFIMLTNYYIINITTNFIPLPAGGGVAELTFAAVFSGIYADGLLFWAMLIWKFFSHYIYLLQGLIVIFIDYIKGNAKVARKSKIRKADFIADELLLEEKYKFEK